MEFLFKSRSEGKRQIKPSQDIQYLEDQITQESSEDSDFKIDSDNSDGDDDNSEGDDDSSRGSSSSNDDDDDDQDEDDNNDVEEEEEEKKFLNGLDGSCSGKDVRGGVMKESLLLEKKDLQYDKKICGSCLGEKSNDINEIVECDGCGISVHEACYGVSESGSVSSNISEASTEPWFCDPCRAGLKSSPVCDFCPRIGGVYKETDSGRFVHLVCALYVEGVTFGDPDKLTRITFFEMNYGNWGKRICTLCEEARFCKSGITIQCDAGMCKAYFHVTCAQANGLLAEPSYSEQDPYIAHCRIHSDKTVIKKRKRSYLTMLLQAKMKRDSIDERNKPISVNSVSSRAEPGETPAHRILRKLNRRHERYLTDRAIRSSCFYVPAKKMPRLVTSSASAIRKIQRLGQLTTGMDLKRQVIQESQITAIRDIKKKWHLTPNFNVEFVAFYQERHNRLKEVQKSLNEQKVLSENLQNSQITVRNKYDQLTSSIQDSQKRNLELRFQIETYRDTLLEFGATLPPHDSLKPLDTYENCHNTSSIDRVNAAAKLNSCGICKFTNDQHLLAHCDTCKLYYHLGCLTPPLTRMPKRSKLYGWQCSECDKLSSDDERKCDTTSPRKLRKKNSTSNFRNHNDGSLRESDIEILDTIDFFIPNNQPSSSSSSSNNHIGQNHITQQQPTTPTTTYTAIEDSDKQRHLLIQKAAMKAEKKKIKKEKKKEKKKKKADKKATSAAALTTTTTTTPVLPTSHQSSSSSNNDIEIIETLNTNNDGRYKPLKLKIKNLLEDTNGHNSPEIINLDDDDEESISSAATSTTAPIKNKGRKISSEMRDIRTECDKCSESGTNKNLVRCDECKKCYHFSCLIPPLKKSPKVAGYGWHCFDCDPSDQDSDWHLD